jgi:HAD superfamily hydrolase (TIGR01509 family)
VGERGCLLFDFGGTLDADGIPWGPRFFDAYRAAGGGLDAAEFGGIFERSDRAMGALAEAPTLGFRVMIQRQAEIVSELMAPSHRVAAERVAERFHEEAVATVERNRPMLERLSRSFTLGIVSNFIGNLSRCLAELRLDPLFSTVIDSAVVGVEKPEPAIFVRALDALGMTPERTWFIGDNPDRDVRPATDLGMMTCWLAPASRPLPAGLRPSHRAASLLELEGLVA